MRYSHSNILLAVRGTPIPIHAMKTYGYSGDDLQVFTCIMGRLNILN
jgi:hypothetical protein